MVRRSARVLVLLIAIAVTALAAWRATSNEQRRAAIRSAAEASDATAAQTLDALADLRASLYAYVAPGQGYEFWSARAEGLLTGIRAGILEVDGAATIAGHPLAAQTMDDLERLTTAELRARESVKAGQARFAGDIIFTDMRDRLDAITAQVAAARRTMARTASSADVGITNEQSLLAGAVLAFWMVAGILLVPLPPAQARALPRPVERGRGEALELSLNDGPVSGDAAVVAGDAASEISRVALGAVPLPDGPLPSLASLASLCSDLGRVSDVAELDSLMSRGAELLGATGLIVWVATRDGSHLAPAAAHGYSAAALARIGSIPVSEDNVTVSAFRDRTATRTAAGDGRPAVAVPLLSASGPVGVMAAEVSPERDLETVTALATVMAAQMATLFQPSDAASDEAAEPAGDADRQDAASGAADAAGGVEPDAGADDQGEVEAPPGATQAGEATGTAGAAGVRS